MKRVLLLIVVGIFLALSMGCSGRQDAQEPGPLPDTEENRNAQATRYLKVVPPSEMLADIAENMAATMPSTTGAEFEEFLTEQIDMEELERIMVVGLTKHFTAEELRALADFYESPVGRSVMDKMGEYMADAMPDIMNLVIEAVE